MKRVVPVVRTGTANLASVLAGLRRAGAEPEITSDPERVLSAPQLVLPGVGAFGAALEQLRADDLFAALKQRITAEQPTLAICLGLQMFGNASEESPGVTGLGVIDATVVHLPDTVRVPQLGWNRVAPFGDAHILTEGHAYFANSYAFSTLPEGWSGATFDHGGTFIAAAERGPVLACQFHPELSGPWGRALLQRWLDA